MLRVPRRSLRRARADFTVKPLGPLDQELLVNIGREFLASALSECLRPFGLEVRARWVAQKPPARLRSEGAREVPLRAGIPPVN